MEFKKISLNPKMPQSNGVDESVAHAVKSDPLLKKQSLNDSKSQQAASPRTTNTMIKKKYKIPKKLISLIVILIVLGAILYGVYVALGSVIQWNDDESDVERKSSLSVDTTNLPTQKPESKSDDKPNNSVQIKGKITVTFIKDKGVPFDNGEVRLINSSGTIVSTLATGADGTNGVVVFGGIPAGSYTVVGGRENEIDVRNVSKSVAIGEGEFGSVTLKLFIDTPVTITVKVTDASGSPRANQSFNLIRPRGDEGDEVFSVSTDGTGAFTQSGVYPDDRWTLKDGDTDVARFTVQPNGQNQTINVKT